MGERMDELKGNVKQGVGNLAGDEQMQAEGRGEATAAKAGRETKGAVQETGGRLKEGLGSLTGNENLEAEGLGDRLKGEARRAG